MHERVAGQDPVYHCLLYTSITTETVSGTIDVQVNAERVNEVNASTVSGDADIRTALASGGEIKLESVSGNLLPVSYTHLDVYKRQAEGAKSQGLRAKSREQRNKARDHTSAAIPVRPAQYT